MPYVPPLATWHRKALLGFLVAWAGSRQLKMVKREEHQCIGQGNKWMATPVTRLGQEGHGKDNTNHQFLPTFCEGNENKCLILLHPHLQAIFFPCVASWLLTPSQTDNARNLGNCESYISRAHSSFSVFWKGFWSKRLQDKQKQWNWPGFPAAPCSHVLKQDFHSTLIVLALLHCKS